MLQPNLPPTAAVSQLSDLIALFRDVKRAEKWVAELAAATEEHTTALKALADGNTAAVALAEKLDKQEAEQAAKAEKLAALEAKINAQKKEQDEAKLFIVSCQSEMKAKEAQHEAEYSAKTSALQALESQMLAAKAEAEADKTVAAQIKAEMQDKLKAVKAALSA